MKKTTLILSLLIAALLLTGCGSPGSNAASADENVKTIDRVPDMLNQAEYLLYENVFYNDYGAQFEGQETIKRGVLGKIRDAFNERDRYYVWGYLDNTKCCDWQWEIVPQDVKSLPPVGSLVIAQGVFHADEQALDGYWITDVTITTEAKYTGAQAELNMQAMTCTLERVQMLNILYRPEAFEGKPFIAYGRIAALNTLEDPYYDGSWQIPFSAEGDCPAIGTMVILQGTVKNSALWDCTLEIKQ